MNTYGKAVQAKTDSREIWKYLSEHPTTSRKIDLPESLWKKIEDCVDHCPMCDFFFGIKNRHYSSCDLCPFKNCGENSPYFRWRYAGTDPARKEAALDMLAVIESWVTEKYRSEDISTWI